MKRTLIIIIAGLSLAFIEDCAAATVPASSATVPNGNQNPAGPTNYAAVPAGKTIEASVTDTVPSVKKTVPIAMEITVPRVKPVVAAPIASSLDHAARHESVLCLFIKRL